MRPQSLFIPRSPFKPSSTHLPAEGRNPLVTILDEMRGEAIRGINVIKQHDIGIAVRDGAVNHHERKVKARRVEAGKRLSWRLENHPPDIFISLHAEVDRFLLRNYIR